MIRERLADFMTNEDGNAADDLLDRGRGQQVVPRQAGILQIFEKAFSAS
jgi:hypothetical protein